MKLEESAVMLRIYIGETDKYKGKPLYEQIVLKARELNLAGATVLRGILGFGSHSCIHAAKLLELSEDMPVVVEIIDIEENVNKILPFLDEAVMEGMVTTEDVKVKKYRKKNLM